MKGTDALEAGDNTDGPQKRCNGVKNVRQEGYVLYDSTICTCKETNLIYSVQKESAAWGSEHLMRHQRMTEIGGVANVPDSGGSHAEVYTCQNLS